MKKATAKRRKSIDFSEGVRGKYAGMNLVIVGETPDRERRSRRKEEDFDPVLDEILAVLNSAGESKRELELAIGRARNLIESARHA
jgi:hypothetical protein